MQLVIWYITEKDALCQTPLQMPHQLQYTPLLPKKCDQESGFPTSLNLISNLVKILKFLKSRQLLSYHTLHGLILQLFSLLWKSDLAAGMNTVPPSVWCLWADTAHALHGASCCLIHPDNRNIKIDRVKNNGY